ncbi:nitroreductase family protein [uncultured Sunxiuqinia sp.]|uniref:nitroreductase family protein n=1 Tax=uncultured Sunxiuqinia sp. TaxID=1573825 RepID=UPI002625156B|nr:nitroreductase family protein [uncultured Sunxiuqinia sp.]
MIELLRSRRSIRKFTSEPVAPKKLEQLQEAVLRSPSSKNGNPWEFIFIDDPKLIQQLSQCKPHGAAFLEKAPLAVIVLADENKGDVWVEDCSIASILLQLTAQSLDLGSCWVQVRKRQHNQEQTAEQYIQHLFQLPENFRVLSIIAIGNPAQTRQGKPSEELEYHKIHHNQFTPGKP